MKDDENLLIYFPDYEPEELPSAKFFYGVRSKIYKL